MDYEKLRCVLPKVHTKWTSDDIAVWLQFIGLEALYPSFKEASIDGSCLACLTEDDLRTELNIKSGITIKKLAKWIKVGIKEFDEYLTNGCEAVAEGSFTNKNLLKSMPLENNRSKKLLSKPSRNSDCQMDVEPVLEKIEEREKPSNLQRPLNELLIQQSDGASSFYNLKEEGAKIGRHSSNKILILQESVSRYHAEIEYLDGQYYIRDIGSTTGTFIKIIDKVELAEVLIRLRQGMIIEMGSNQFEVFSIVENELVLRVVQGPNMEQSQIVIPIPPSTKINCGRKVSNAIHFPDDQHLSNIHASITNIEGKFLLEDLATTNGYFCSLFSTWQRLSEEGTESPRYLLKDKTVFKIGTTYTYTCSRNSAAPIEEKCSQNTCVICYENEKDCVYQPCNHNAGCIRCSKGLKECPICRKRIEDFIRIYRS